MSRAVRRIDFPGNDGQWRASVEERLRRLFSVAGTGPHEPPGVVTLAELVANPDIVVGFENSDSVVATGPGTVLLQLTYLPNPVKSLQVWWGGVPQPPTEWTLVGNVVIIPDPTGIVRAGHKFTAYYRYTSIGATPIPPVTPTGSIGWASTGPRLIVTEGDTTDHSSPLFDDSVWTSSPAPVGLIGFAYVPPADTWPLIGTSSGSVNAGIWLRRHVTVAIPSTFTINARIDGQWWLYLDGIAIASSPTNVSFAQVGPFVVTVSPGEHIVALHVNDDSPDPAGDSIYADMNVAVA